MNFSAVVPNGLIGCLRNGYRYDDYIEDTEETIDLLEAFKLMKSVNLL